MNLTDLHYVVEIEKSGSISKAAKELYVAQPNLSKAIKHLEREFGISIFERSSKGVKATREGQKFLEYAKRIIYEIKEMKRDCSDLGKENLSFKITVPRASYISSAFAEFIGMKSKETAIKAEFQENSSMHAIENVLQNGYSMGIIRYLCENESYFQSLLDLKGLDAELLAELPYVILTSANGDLAKRELKTREELEDGVEILHGDWKLPTGEYTELSENGESLHPHNKIYIFERGSQFDILREVKNSYMWVSPVPEKLRKKYNLVQKYAGFSGQMIRDVLIYKKGYQKKLYEREFIGHLKETICEMM